MSLRDRLKRSVEAELHVALPRDGNDATAARIVEPTMQQKCNSLIAPLGEGGASRATVGETGMQLTSCTPIAAAPQEHHSELRCSRVRTPDAEHAAQWESHALGPKCMAHARLIAMGLCDPEADKVAEWMTLRQDVGDDQIVCYECKHFRPSGKRCENYKAAEMPRELGADLATKPQRCPGFADLFVF